MAQREAKSFCRICSGFCGMVLTLEDERIVSVRGDKSHPMTRGYACIKGLQAPEAHHGPDRLLHPKKRLPDGSFQTIGLEQALDEIGARLKLILDRDGPDALASFRGTINVFSAVNSQMLGDWLRSLGSSNFYSTMTIDQSSKWVTVQRLGMWAAGKQTLDDADVWLLAGNNPLVSIGSPGLSAHPSFSLREAKARGMKLIVVDPRRSETAQHADLFLQIRPGEDATLAAGLLRIILAEGWQDQAFCDRYVSQLDALRSALDPFTPSYVAQRCGITVDELQQAATLFGTPGRRGIAHSGTGVTMGPHSNLADHLYEVMNVVCGRYLRPGERIPNPGAMAPVYPRRAEVWPPSREFEKGPRSRVGSYGTMFGEKMTGVLADEILRPGPGQIKSLFVDGGNPVSAIPDQRKVVQAFNSLELLVTIDPYMTTTARLSHYVLPPRVFFEHADLTPPLYETAIFTRPFASYTPAVIEPPPGSEVVEDWYVFWALAKRLGKQIVFNGEPLDMSRAPTSDELHALLLRHTATPFETMREHAGELLDMAPVFVEPPNEQSLGRFEVAPHDVLAELAALLAEPSAERRAEPGADATPYTHRLVSRRMRDVSNSMYQQLPAIRKRHPYNPAYMNPADMASAGLANGSQVTIVSAHGRIPAIVEAEEAVRPGVVSMSHSWGGLPDDAQPVREGGSCTSLLISTDRHLDPINAMPWMSAVPVYIEQG